MRFKSIVLGDILSNFAILAPFKGRDRLFVYSDKKDALRMFAMYNLGEYNKSDSLSCLSSLDSFEYVNVVESKKTYNDLCNDLYNDNNRMAKLKFLWTGKCSERERNILQKYFSMHTDLIYFSLKDFLMSSADTSVSIKNNEIEDVVSLLSYQAKMVDLSYRAKRKKRKLILQFAFIIYILIGATIAILLSMNKLG